MLNVQSQAEWLISIQGYMLEQSTDHQIKLFYYMKRSVLWKRFGFNPLGFLLCSLHVIHWSNDGNLWRVRNQEPFENKNAPQEASFNLRVYRSSFIPHTISPPPPPHPLSCYSKRNEQQLARQLPKVNEFLSSILSILPQIDLLNLLRKTEIFG